MQRARQNIGDDAQAAHQVELLEDKANVRAHGADVAGDLAVLLNRSAVYFDRTLRIMIARHQPGHMTQQS